MTRSHGVAAPEKKLAKHGKGIESLARRPRHLNPAEPWIKLFADTQTVKTGDKRFELEISDTVGGMDLVFARIYVTTVSSSGLVTVQLNNVTQAVDMLSTRLTIDANELSSRTAATPYVIDTGNDDVADGDHIRIDVDTAGTGAKGLGIILRFAFPDQ